jgi:hypothetical protein
MVAKREAAMAAVARYMFEVWKGACYGMLLAVFESVQSLEL